VKSIQLRRKEATRKFCIKKWKIDPRVSFLSWAGRSMDPVSIDWVLERLGFIHAKTTIPKWIQRGGLDPLDYGLAILLRKLIERIKSI